VQRKFAAALPPELQRLLEFGAQRRRGQTLLRVVPCSARAPLFAVELVTDDMPFLVDTQTLIIERAGLGLRVITHPILQVERDARACCSPSR
jgi:glutamate dehydrogenase